MTHEPTIREKDSCSSCDELRARLAAAEASRDEARRQVEQWKVRAETAEVALDKAWTELAARAPQEQP